MKMKFFSTHLIHTFGCHPVAGTQCDTHRLLLGYLLLLVATSKADYSLHCSPNMDEKLGKKKRRMVIFVGLHTTTIHDTDSVCIHILLKYITLRLTWFGSVSVEQCDTPEILTILNNFIRFTGSAGVEPVHGLIIKISPEHDTIKCNQTCRRHEKVPVQNSLFVTRDTKVQNIIGGQVTIQVKFDKCLHLPSKLIEFSCW